MDSTAINLSLQLQIMFPVLKSLALFVSFVRIETFSVTFYFAVFAFIFPKVKQVFEDLF